MRPGARTDGDRGTDRAAIEGDDVMARPWNLELRSAVVVHLAHKDEELATIRLQALDGRTSWSHTA